MKVIKVPGRLRLSALMLWLAIPIAALETIIATRAPWWRLPYRSMELWSLAVAMVVIPLSTWIQGGRRWALNLSVGILAVWVVLSALFSIRSHHPALGFFTLFLMLYFGMVTSWLDQELSRSYFDPRLRWFQGLPKPIPGLLCEAGGRTLRVARMDEEGAFLFDPAPGARELETGRLRLAFAFRDRAVQCEGLAVRFLRDRNGIGVQFGDIYPDARKELGDFVEALKGEGYVD